MLFCFLSRALVNADKQYSNTFDITPIRSALIDTSCGTRTTETRAFLLHKKRYSRDELNTHLLIRMSAYGFGGQSATQRGVDATLAKKLSRWEHHRLETSDALESVEKASKQFQECCTSKSSVSAEEKIRSRNIFKREFERFKDALEKLENCLTMGYVLVVVVSHSSHLDGLVCLLVLLRVRVVRCILVVLSSFLPLTRKRSFSRLLLSEQTRRETLRIDRKFYSDLPRRSGYSWHKWKPMTRGARC